MDAHVIFEIVVGILIPLLMFWQTRRDANREKAKAKEAEEQKAKEAEIHESFQSMDRKLDDEREKRENLKEFCHSLELKMAEMVKREEMTDLYNRIDAIKTDVLNALTKRPT